MKFMRAGATSIKGDRDMSEYLIDTRYYKVITGDKETIFLWYGDIIENILAYDLVDYRVYQCFKHRNDESCYDITQEIKNDIAYEKRVRNI